MSHLDITLHNVLGPFAVSNFDPVALFAGGAVGGLYDPSDMASLFQDEAGLVPVTAAGQSVRRMSDLSGNGAHLIAPSDAARPVLETDGTSWWIASDGVDDWMISTPLIDLSMVWTHVGGWRADAAGKSAFGTSSTNRGRVRADGIGWRWNRPDGGLTNIAPGDPLVANVLTLTRSAVDAIAGRYNGGTETSAIPYDTSADIFGLSLFSSTHVSYASGFAGRFYGGVWINRVLDMDEREAMETWCATRAGVML